MPSSLENQRPIFLLWLVATLFCNEEYKTAQMLITDGLIRVNGQTVGDLLHWVRSGDTLTWGQNIRPVDLAALKNAHVLRRRYEAMYGGAEASYKRLGVYSLPAAPPA